MVADRLASSEITLVADRQIDLRRVLGKNSWWPTDRLIYEGCTLGKNSWWPTDRLIYEGCTLSKNHGLAQSLLGDTLFVEVSKSV